MDHLTGKDIAIEENEVQYLMEVLTKFFSNSNFEVIPGNPAIILTSRNVGYICTEDDRLGLDNYARKFILPSETGLGFCIEVATPSGKRIYLINEGEYPKIQANGIQMRSEKLKKGLQKYFENHDSTNAQREEVEAADIMTGKYGLIMPVIAGIKPAAVTNKLPTSKNLLDSMGLKLQFYKNSRATEIEDYVIYHPQAVLQAVRNYPEIFRAIGIDESMEVEKVIEKTLGKTDALSMKVNSREFIKAIGIILGFDRKSCEDFMEQKKTKDIGESFFEDSFELCNIWSVAYKISLEDNNDYEELKNKYSSLLKTLEDLLEEGFSPREVLGKVAIRATIDKICQKAKNLTVHATMT